MNTELLKHKDFGEIRMQKVNGEPWFVAKDICNALGYGNSREALKKHVKDNQKDVTKCDTLGGQQDISIINEAGMYRLVLRSKMTQAERFTDWVTSEVLPSIRKTGSYDGLAEKVAEPKVSMWVSKEKKEDFLASIIRITNQKERVAVYENWMRYRESISVQLNH